MKKIKLLTLFVFCTLLLVFTSCLDSSDNDNTLSDAQIAQCINSIKGDYDGNLIYESQNPNVSTDKTDSIEISWRVQRTDTAAVLSVYDIPSNLIAQNIDNGDIKTALLNTSYSTLNAVVAFFQDTPTIGFMIYPMPIKYTITYGGASHELTAYFYSGRYSFGYYSSAQKFMRMQLVLGGVYLDGNLQNNLLKQEEAFILDAKW